MTFPIAVPGDGGAWAGWILWLPLVALVACGLCAAMRVRSKLPAWITVAALGASFALTLALYFGYEAPVVIHLFDWIELEWSGGGRLLAPFSLYLDRLTLLWMLFVTGLGALIALYASEYMEADVKSGRQDAAHPERGGYARFFAGVSVFLFAMSALVMGDNLLMLYLGWEGVGFASYWLIGYYFTKPSAVAAAKKAFIVNRIGDVGLALGLYLTYHAFGTIEYAGIFAQLQAGADPETTAGGWPIKVIPFLLMLGAFGKSAQLPLYVWLPDAMEGPTPVSALIHAATMVTAGVYLLCRLFPLMSLHPAALPTVAWVGGLTALLAATIGMAQFDIKRIMAYSTVSQLGYMFMGVGLLTTYGAAYHVFTHAFFKAVLFLTCGAIMHGFAGQLDLRRISGLRRMPGWGVVSWTMLYACLCLVGFPIISSGFWSKDLIMAEAFARGEVALGAIAVATALLTAYYTFRVWFRVCAGPVHFEMGEEDHGAGGGHDAGHGHGREHGRGAHGHGQPHPPRLAINGVLVVITIGAVASIVLGPVTHWAQQMVEGSSAAPAAGAHPAAHADGFLHDPHRWMPWLASAVTLVGIAIAWHFHLARRGSADALKAALLANPLARWLPVAMERKWYVDEIYDVLLRKPLWVLGVALSFIDQYLLDLVMVDGIGRTPRWVARLFQPLQNGVLQSYAVTMAAGAGLVALLVLYMPGIVRAILNGGAP
jgi:NADH-quinone oxidoreductase subunit L